MWTTPDGDTAPALVAVFEQEGIILTGNVIPSVNNAYNLGNNTNKWSSIHIGPDSIFIEDSVLGTDAEITVADGALLINGVAKIEIGNMQMTTTGISLLDADSGANLIVGETTNTGYMEIDMVGIKFKDGTLQTTAAIPLAQRGNAGGVATLGLDGIVPASQLPAGGVSYQGTWNANTNTPTLADGSGSGGDEYAVVVAGTQNLGSGSITFAVGDFVIYNGTIWQKIPGTGGVTSFNTRTGAVTLQSGDVTNALSNGSITNNFLSTDYWTLTTGQGIGLTGNGTVELGDSITLTNTGVTAAVGGTGVAVSAETGNVTFSIGQAVGGANSVSFLAVNANTTIQATGNVTGGNLTTAGRVVATGNIVTSGYVITPGTIINSGISSTGNITGGNLIGNNLTPTRVTFVGPAKGITDDAEFTYDPVTNTLSVGNVSATGNVTAAYYFGNGSTLTGTTGGSTYYAQFWSTVSQVNAGATAANPMTFDTSDTFNNGVSVASYSHVVITNPGVYNIQFSAQFAKTDSGQDTVSIWLAKNGVNVPDTCTDIDLNNNNARSVAAWNFLVEVTVPNTYYELYWSSADTSMSILAQGARINPTRPAIPSVILTVTQA
jgi:hypothetical protein